MDYAFKLTDYAFKLTDYAFELMDYAFKLTDYAFELMDHALGLIIGRRHPSMVISLLFCPGCFCFQIVHIIIRWRLIRVLTSVLWICLQINSSVHTIYFCSPAASSDQDTLLKFPSTFFLFSLPETYKGVDKIRIKRSDTSNSCSKPV